MALVLIVSPEGSQSQAMSQRFAQHDVACRLLNKRFLSVCV